ncbi:hypothetical protein N7474_006770 [Penicillium riverlandense]|uniref:uncharacterized protein n=1 Tax=Penicillium riverlandense TaxID=1903569 RepID=UPI0025496313|nr:uncharacterized protein N7474_006770 [Penicillium riverlandense]KAJ5814993.1 hypothetical protein N7474_006770 [Penicillium riverlandense]
MSLKPGLSFGDKFASFNIFQASYKQVDGHNIRADLIIPAMLPANGPRPVIARFHGGGLSRGDSLYADWFPLWLLELAQTHGAIIASANYRFLPEATGLQILEDVDDFWSWLHSNSLKEELASQLTPIELDLERVIAAGDSAGGLLSIYLTLTYPDQLRAGTAQYPQLAHDEPTIYPPTRSAMDREVPESFIDEYIATLQPGACESSDLECKRVDLSSALSQHRRARGFYIRDSESSPHRDRLFQLPRLDQPDARLPRGGLVILHGRDDDDVMPAVSERFAARAKVALKGRPGGDKVVLCMRPGGHGFDVNASVQEKWLSEALEKALEAWLE